MMIMQSRKPAAIRFKYWIASDLLPTLRVKGHYQLEDYSLPSEKCSRGEQGVCAAPIDAVQMSHLSKIVSQIGDCFHFPRSAQWHAWKRVRETFGIRPIVNLPSEHYEKAVDVLNDMLAIADEFKGRVQAAEKEFCKQVLLMDGDISDLDSQLRIGGFNYKKPDQRLL